MDRGWKTAGSAVRDCRGGGSADDDGQGASRQGMTVAFEGERSGRVRGRYPAGRAVVGSCLGEGVLELTLE